MMAGLEKVSESLELAESKRNSLNQSILSLLVQWRNFEGQLDLTEKDFSEGFRELDSREKKLNSEKELLELTRESVERRAKEVGDREKDFALFREKKVRDLELREKELVRIKEDYGKEVDETLSEQDKKIQGLQSALKSEQLRREELENLVEKRFKEIGLKEKSLEDKRREIELIEISIEKRTRELQHNEGKIKERERMVELKKEELNLWKERQIEIKSKERQLQLMIEDLEFQEKKSDFLRELNEKRMEELDLKEKQLEKNFKQNIQLKEEGCRFEKELLEEGLKDLESKRKSFDEQITEFELRKKELQESFKEFHLKNNNFLSEKKLLEKESKSLQEKKKEFEDGIKQFELREQELQESLKEFHLKKKEFLLGTNLLEKESKDLESKWKEFELRIEEFNAREKVLKESFQEFHAKENQFQLEKKLLKNESEHLESRKKELEESIKKFELREKEKDFELRIEEFNAREKVLKESFQEFHAKENQFQLEKKLLKNESEHLESRRKELEESIKKFELREKELQLKEEQLHSVTHAHSKTGPVLDADSQDLLCNSTDIDIRSVVMIDGKDLQIFLNEHVKDHHWMGDEVFKALHLCKEPAKLVLNAMEGFFPPHLRKGNIEFSGYVVRRSCLLLLQQLFRMSPQIQPCVRDEALKLAREWKTKIVTSSSLEVFSFLCLLAIYDVASAFDAEDIMRYLDFVSQHKQKLEPEFCRRLGLKEKIPSLIENLLSSNRSLEAIEFIYGFELVDRFPPVPILKNYLKHVKTRANSMLINKCTRQNVQNESIDIRVAATRSVIRCIVDHKLQSQYSPKDLENTIKQLLMQKQDKKYTGSSNSHKAQAKQKVEAKQISSAAAPCQPKANRSMPDLSDTRTGPCRPMAVIIANMDGKNVLSFLSSHVVEHELLHSEVSSALQISDNPAKLVLDAVESLYGSHQTEEGAKSCIFLLEQLMVVSPNIMPDVKETAQKIAFDWHAKLKAKNGNPLLILMFLLVVHMFRLSSTFPRDELLNLYQTVAEQKPSPGLSHALEICRDMSYAAALHSQVEAEKATSKSLSTNNLAVSSSVVPELDDESLCTNMHLDGKERATVCSGTPTFIKHSSDPAELILDALRNCHQSNFSKSKNAQLVFKSFSHLLEKLMGVSLEINPNVKGLAHEFALDWKAKFIGPHQWEALGFLQLVATYQLSSVFSSDELFGLLEVVYQPKKASNLIRIFDLVDNVPGFISQLIKKKKLLHAFAYVYDFNLAHMFPPVALLKQHVRYSQLVAKKICNERRKTPQELDEAIVSEISALKTVIKLIRQRGLQSEYPPDELRSTIEQLESQRANLKTSMQKVDANEVVSAAPELQMQQVETKKRSANYATPISEGHLQPANKFPRLVSPSQFTNHHLSQSGPALSQSLGEPSRHYSLIGPPLILPPQNQFLPSHHNAVTYTHIPPLRIPGEQSFYPRCHNPNHPKFQRTN